MIQFMVLGGPRSGTAWAANWLSTDTTLCLHDPLWQHHYSELDAIESDKMLGMACTGAAHFPDWINAHPARKVILHRSIDEINSSLHRLGLPPVDRRLRHMLQTIHGLHVHWLDLFNDPRRIYEHLLERPLDAQRHTLLRHLNVQMAFERIEVNAAAAQRLMGELTQAAMQVTR